MRRAPIRTTGALTSVAILLLLCSAAGAGPTAPVSSIPIIVTAAPQYDSLAALHGGERFPQGAQLMLLRFGRMAPFVRGFAASADASVSFDGKSVLFSGKKGVLDPWQIWEVPVESGNPRRVMAAPADLIRPLWMPGARMVYARKEADRFVMETAALDGTDALALSYGPGNYIPDDVLRDGRILFESGFPLGAGTTPEMYLVYADGSGVESVRCDHGIAREHGRQMLSGDVVFTQSGRLARFTSASAGDSLIKAPAGEYAGDVAEMPEGRWLLSVRRPAFGHYGLALWNPDTSITSTLARDGARDLIQPAVVAPRAVPKRHPSALHGWQTSNLLALDARLSRDAPVHGIPATVRLETLNEAGQVIALGTAPVEADGSFFVQVMGDRPLRFVLLDAAGETLRQEHGWFWSRRGEQRICVGCHTGPERAPENRVPQILLRTTTPVDLTGAATSRMGGGR